MRLSGFLNRDQVEDIHRNALRVLEEVGVEVDHVGLHRRLEALGGVVDALSNKVRFPARVIEDLIQNTPKSRPRADAPEIALGCSVFQCLYSDPASGELLPFDETLLARYLGLAESLPGVDRISLLGLPFVPHDIPTQKLPLAEKLYAWKLGASPAGTVQLSHLCEPILDMYEVHASYQGKNVEDVFTACGFMVSPLKLARPECDQLLFFAERGLRMYIGHLPSQGGTAPVTLAGTLVLALAEQLFLFILDHALWGDAVLALGGMASTIDMRTGVSCYGRPERHRVNLAFADIAAFYGCSCAGHTGATDAHTPSYEAGVQKATGVLATALATGSAFIEGGLLGIDEICSPVQLVLDHDLATSLRSLLATPVVDVEHCAFDEIAAAGAAGNHLGTEYTVDHFRSSLFEPISWSNQLASAWRASGQRIDLDKARDIVSDFDRHFVRHSHISEEEEQALKAIIGKPHAR